MQITDIVILAGGKADRLDPEAPFKGMVRIGGCTLIEHTVRTLLAMGKFRKIILTVPHSLSKYSDQSLSSLQEALNDPRVTEVVTDSGVIDNLVSGVSSCEGEYVMVVTVDTPLLTQSSLEKMEHDCSNITADFYYPIITEASIKEEFPEFHKTVATVKEGRYAGGNLFITKRKVPVEGHDTLAELFELRKSPVKLVGRLGIGFLAKYALKQLSIKDVEAKISQLMHSQGKAVVVEPDIGIDLDKSEDFDSFSSRLNAKQNRSEGADV